MFSTHGKQSVTLDNFGGLITQAPPESLPEGASPLTWDCDFPIGGFTTRPGLQSLLNSGQARNFVYVKTMRTLDGTLRTLALDATGQLWVENVTLNSGVLTAVNIFNAGDMAQSTSAFNREYLSLSTPFGVYDTPWQFDGTVFDRISQEGPGANAQYQVNAAANPNLANITSYSITSNVVTFQAANSFTNGEIIQIQLPSVSFLNGQVLTVIATGLSASQFEANFTAANTPSTAVTGTASPLTNFPISTITQAAQVTISASGKLLWSAGPGSPNAGTTITVYYGNSNAPQDPVLVQQFQAGIPVYVYMTFSNSPFVNGTYQVTSLGSGLSVNASAPRPYFTFQAPSSNFVRLDPPGATTYQVTLATVTLTTPAPNVVEGGTVNIQGATPTSWNNTWGVVQTPNGGVLNINATALAAGVATYTWAQVSGSAPVVGDLVTVQNTTNGNGIFNVTNATIASVTGPQFTINGFAGAATIGSQVETGSAQTFGRIFSIDPGSNFVGGTNQTNPIFGNDSGTGQVVITNTVLNIGAGTRQAVVLFKTRNGFLTRPSPPVTFTTNQSTASITCSNLPIGPPNVIGRVVAFTEAGANGVPGAFFYYIPVPVSTIVNGQPFTFQPTVVNDNVSTTASFVFTDAILLDSTEIDVPNNDLFALRELGNCRWNVLYANRMFYGQEQLKIVNLDNISFNGGYQATSGAPLFPSGWSADATNGSGGSLVTSTIFGQSYQIQNATGSTQAVYGMITQGAFQDAYQAPIFQQNVAYSIRVTAAKGTNLDSGNLVVDLTTFDTQRGYGTVYGSFTLALSNITTSQAVYTGTLLVNKFPTVPSSLVLRLYATNITNNSTVIVDRIEPFDASQPVNLSDVAASYNGAPESVAAVTGNVGLSARNNQATNGAFVMYDQLYFLKQQSMFVTSDSKNDEPASWDVHEVSNRVGTCSIWSYDVGEEWMATACREGVFVFTGGSPVKLSQEIQQAWDLINWNAAGSMWLKVDIQNRRIHVGAPMATPNPYLPLAPTNANPQSPNVEFVLNYVGIGDIRELAGSPQMHVTMFGNLVSVDMKRKWNIWQINAPYADLITRADGISRPLVLCNGNASGKLYQLQAGLTQDDGATNIPWLYTTYGFVNSGMSKQNPLLGFHRKLFTYLQLNAYGSGTMAVKFLANRLNADAKHTWSVLSAAGGITLQTSPVDDLERSINVAGNRVFTQFSGVGASSATVSKMILVGGVHPTMPLRGSASA